jgi:hypothetical protein
MMLRRRIRRDQGRKKGRWFGQLELAHLILDGYLLHRVRLVRFRKTNADANIPGGLLSPRIVELKSFSGGRKSFHDDNISAHTELSCFSPTHSSITSHLGVESRPKMMASSPSISKGQYLHGPRHLRLEARQMAPIGPSDVRIRIRSTTLCGSDVHYFKFHKNGSIEVKEPLCGGHEAAGEVVEVGPNASKSQNIRVGDRVAIESGVACLDCDKCSSGRYNICSKMRFRSSGASFPHLQGTLQEYVDHPAEWCHR